MTTRTVHPTDADLLLVAAGEDQGVAAMHVASCGLCRARMRELDARLDRTTILLKEGARDEVLEIRSSPSYRQPGWLAGAAAALALTLLGGWFAVYRPTDVEYAESPDPARTPGAVREGLSARAVCSAGPEAENVPVSHARAMAVFKRYDIHRPEPRKFEVDYLIPPDLGGSDDPANLWPQPYASGVWNSRVKDALEDRLRAMVCSGEMDLATAQAELSRDWIGAYKRLFRTERPLVDHAGFVKDRPWE
jgi:hypothetical protein